MAGDSMERLSRELDWAGTAVGGIDGWPAPLASAVELCLAAIDPCAVFWGGELTPIFNDAFRKLLPDGSIRGRAGQELGSAGSALLPAIGEVTSSGAAKSIEAVRIEISSEGERWFAFSVVPIKHGAARAAGVFVIGRDETMRVLAERRLATFAGEVRDEREQTLSIISHDLKNPLNVIALSTYQLGTLRGLPQELEQRVIKQVEAIKRSTRRINDLIGDVLDIARVETGTLTLEKEPQDAAKLVSDAVEHLMPAAQQKSLVIQTSVEPGLVVSCDRERTVRAISGMVQNAIAFSHERGIVLVSVREHLHQAMFEIRDTGPGIANDAMPLLFDRMLHKMRGDKRKLGRGLPLAKGVVEAQGGHIWAESTPGRGAAFFFTLPLAGADSDQKPK